MQNLTAEERETIIRYSYADDIAIVFTYDKPLQKKLTSLVKEREDIAIIEQGDEWTEYKVPKKWVKVRPPKQVNMTEEQKQAAAKRLMESRKLK